jgi:hypothetical protein
MYTVLAILWLFLVWREIEIGPEPRSQGSEEAERQPGY